MLAVRAAGFELEASELQVQRSNHSATLPLYGKAGYCIHRRQSKSERHQFAQCLPKSANERGFPLKLSAKQVIARMIEGDVLDSYV